MEYAKVKGIDKRVSRLVQGTIMLTEREPERGFELLDAAWEAGYTAFDTAALYGGGTCERVFGAWMEARGVRQQAFVIGKSCHHNGDRRRVTSFDIAADLHDSLARQRTDYVDLHLLHRDDPEVEVGPIVDALNGHVDAGRMRAFGGSNWSPERIEEANQTRTDSSPSPPAAPISASPLKPRFRGRVASPSAAHPTSGIGPGTGRRTCPSSPGPAWPTASWPAVSPDRTSSRSAKISGR